MPGRFWYYKTNHAFVDGFMVRVDQLHQHLVLAGGEAVHGDMNVPDPRDTLRAAEDRSRLAAVHDRWSQPARALGFSCRLAEGG